MLLLYGMRAGGDNQFMLQVQIILITSHVRLV